ncbi:MAG: pyruvate dehydrogenase (acetyl-transferring) E1 component subunit alpha [Calditrichia bacterium]
MFKEYDPLKNKMFKIMDENGEIINQKIKLKTTPEQILEAYKTMLFVRTADLMTVSYQRQGRMYTYPPNIGQEAIAIGTGLSMKKDDWLVPAYRELGLYLMRGVSLKEIFLFWGGNEKGARMEKAHHVLPLAVPIASQLLHAAGIGYAVNYQKKKEVVFTFVGDGGTSEGDFHEALNFAGVWNAPVVFIVQNNQYAISMPRHKQTKSLNIAVKGVAYGVPGLLVDGNDLLAMQYVTDFARNHAAKGNGPVLIEALTYRKGAHTTSDDPKKYRTEEEEKAWEIKDPMMRIRKYLEKQNLISDEQEAELIETFKQEIDLEFQQFENESGYSIEEVFESMYVDMPADLQRQRVEYEKFLNWKEANL